MNRCPFLLPPCGFFEFYKTGIVKDIVIALKRDLYRKRGEEISGEDRFLDSPRFFFLSFKPILLSEELESDSNVVDERFSIREYLHARLKKRKEKRGGKKERKEKGKRVSLIYV